MLAVALRLCVAALMLAGGLVAVDAMLGTDLMGAIARLVAWFWVRSIDVLTRVAAKVSLPLAKAISAFGKKAVVRVLTKPLWRLVVLFVALFVIGKARRDLSERWLQGRRSALLRWLKRWLEFKPDWPRGVRAAIAAVVIVAFVALFVWISVHVGSWWGLGASIVLWMIVEKAKLIGLDALTSWMVETWAPVRAIIARRPWLRWVWLGPVFDWLAKSLDAYSERHADRNKGRSSIEVWRDRRQRRLELLRQARKGAARSRSAATQRPAHESEEPPAARRDRPDPV